MGLQGHGVQFHKGVTIIGFSKIQRFSLASKNRHRLLVKCAIGIEIDVNKIVTDVESSEE